MTVKSCQIIIIQSIDLGSVAFIYSCGFVELYSVYGAP